MKNSSTYIIHNFLTYANTLDVLLGDYFEVGEYRTHYSRIARLFGIRDKELLDSYLDIIESDLVSGADCESKYNLLSRAIEFNPNKFSKEFKTVVNYRKPAIQIKTKIAKRGDVESKSGIIRGISYLTNSGVVSCIVLLAYMKLYGLFVGKDMPGAIKGIREAAVWNDPFALILGFKHDRNKAIYPPILKAVCYTASQEEAYKHLEKHLGLPEEVRENPVSIALDKRFYSDLSSKEIISYPILQAMNSSVLTESSKVYLVETSDKEPNFSALPLNITRNSPIVIPKKLTPARRLGDREQETAAILSNFALYRRSRNSEAEYKPLLIICPDEYLLDSFKHTIIKSFHQSGIIRVDLACAPPSNFSPINDNPIVTEMNREDNARVAILIEGCSDISEAAQADLARFLRASARCELHHHHSLRFDYSGILPILTSTSSVSPELLRECDVVKLAPAREDDKSDLIRGIIDDKKHAFSLESISIDEDAIKSLCRHPLSTVCSVIDRVVSLKAHEGHAIITDQDIIPLLPKKSGFEASSFWG